MTATTPQIGDQVGLVGTNIAGDVRRVDTTDGNDRVTFRVNTVQGKSKGAKAARAWRGTWVTCASDLLMPQAEARLSAALRPHVERLLSEFAARYSRDQIERSVEVSAAHYVDARITTYVPILVYRDARSLLSESHSATPAA